MAIETTRRLFTIHDYHRMVDAGILHENDRAELIRMADSSLEYDQRIKAALYAETQVAQYRIADIHNDRLLVYSDLRDVVYQSCRPVARGETLTPLLLPGCPIHVDMLLP